MPRKETRLLNAISWEDLLLNVVVSWFAKKFFDFLWEKAKMKIQFQGKIHLGRYLLIMFGEFFLFFLTGWLIGRITVPSDYKKPEFQESLANILKLHRRYHSLVGNKLCRYCRLVISNRRRLEMFVSDPRLYPPFEF